MKRWLVVVLVLLSFAACQRPEQDEMAAAGDELSGGTDVISRADMIDGIPVEDMTGGTDVQGGERPSYKEIPAGTPAVYEEGGTDIKGGSPGGTVVSGQWGTPAVCEKGGTPPVYQKVGTPAANAPGGAPVALGGTPIAPVEGGTLVDCPGGTPVSASQEGGTVVYPPGVKPPERMDSPAEGAGKVAPGSRAAKAQEKEDDPLFLACTFNAGGYINNSDGFLNCLAEAKGPVHISSVDGLYKQGYRLIQVVEPKDGKPIYYFDKKKEATRKGRPE